MTTFPFVILGVAYTLLRILLKRSLFLWKESFSISKHLRESEVFKKKQILKNPTALFL